MTGASFNIVCFAWKEHPNYEASTRNPNIERPPKHRKNRKVEGLCERTLCLKSDGNVAFALMFVHVNVIEFVDLSRSMVDEQTDERSNER